MHIATVLTPADLTPRLLRDRVAIVIDQLRASTTITTALANGASAVHAFDSLEAALAGRAAEIASRPLLAGEVRCVKPEGFDLGNSPSSFTSQQVRGRVVMLSTTNGTRALLRTREAASTLIGCIRNAAAVAAEVVARNRNVVLVCAGTGGEPSDDDTLTAGIIAASIARLGHAEMDDVTRLATEMRRDDLEAQLQETLGGRNLIAVNLADDIAFAAQLDAATTLGRVAAFRDDRAVITPSIP